MSKVSRFLRSTKKKVKQSVSHITGSHYAKQAAQTAETAAAEASADRAKLEEKTKKEKAKASKLSVRGLRSRRAAAYFAKPTGENPTYGSPTIG